MKPMSVDPRQALTAGERRGRHAPPGQPADAGDSTAIGSARRPDAEPITQLQHHPAHPRGRHSTGYGQNYARVVGWTLLGSVLPGSGLIAAGRRGTGVVVLTLSVLLAAAGAAFALLGDPVAQLTQMVGTPDQFLILAAALVGVVLLWALVVIGTHFSLRRYAHLNLGQRMVCSVMVTALIALVVIPTAKAGSYAVILRDTVTGIFSADVSTTSAASRPNATHPSDPWASLPRVNVLMIGSDAGADRIGIRPDTLILASIDTKTGDTVLFSLPRNLQKVPFPPGTRQALRYPTGYECTDSAGVPQCLLNAIWTFGEENWKLYYPEEATAFDAGLRATTEAVTQLTGLPVDQYAMLNLRGFMQFVDAIGGITMNVRQRLPIGGSSENRVASDWIEPGLNKHLDGYHALWFARSRWSTNDYDRMRRQRCVIGAVVKQADPARLALAFPQIAAAAKNNITTGIPLADLSAWVTLTQRVQKAKVRSLPFTSLVVDTENPNVAEMHQLVAEAINPPPASATPTPSASTPTVAKPSASPSVSTHPSAVDPVQARTAQDVTEVC
jgi:LCP family protein required for cell wall assembly